MKLNEYKLNLMIILKLIGNYLLIILNLIVFWCIQMPIFNHKITQEIKVNLVIIILLDITDQNLKKNNLPIILFCNPNAGYYEYMYYEVIFYKIYQ